MDSKMKHIIIAAAILVAGLSSCSRRYELNIPFALNRVELRLRARVDSSYVMVYSQGPWAASLKEDAPWLRLSRTEGSGTGQITIYAEANTGMARGVVLTVRSGREEKELSISQKGVDDE